MTLESRLKQGIKQLSCHPWFVLCRECPVVSDQWTRFSRTRLERLEREQIPILYLMYAHRSMWQKLVRDDDSLVYRNAWSEGGAYDHKVDHTGIHRIQPLVSIRHWFIRQRFSHRARAYHCTRFFVRQMRRLAMDTDDRFERRLFTLLLEMFFDLLTRKTKWPHPALLIPDAYRSADHRDACPIRRFRYLMANVHRIDSHMRLKSPEFTLERLSQVFSMMGLMLDEWFSHDCVQQADTGQDTDTHTEVNARLSAGQSQSASLNRRVA